MRAVVALGGRLTCEEVPNLTPQPGEVLVKTLSCGICGSDMHALHHLDRIIALSRRMGNVTGGIDSEKPVVFGHEFCAEVLDYGPGSARRFKPGTRVVSMPFIVAPSRFDAVGWSNNFPGGYAEQMLLGEAMLLEVPNGLSAQHASMTEPFSVGAHAVGKAALDEPSAALVIGCGPVGLAVIASLKARGYGPVMAADFSPARRKVAERMGADIIIDPAVESPHSKWSELGVGGDLMDTFTKANQTAKRAIIFECVGVRGVLQGLIEGAPAGAQIVASGGCMETDAIEPYMAITKQIDFRFVLGYTPEEFSQTLHNIAEGRIDADLVVTGAVGLSGVADAYTRLATPDDQLKIVIEPWRN